jgi:hypothetical protein
VKEWYMEVFLMIKFRNKKMLSKYMMKIYAKRHSVPGGITNWQALENGNVAAQ